MKLFLNYITQFIEVIVAPIDGTVIRAAYPYAKKVYTGILLENDSLSLKMFYSAPYKKAPFPHILIPTTKDTNLQLGKGLLLRIYNELKCEDRS